MTTRGETWGLNRLPLGDLCLDWKNPRLPAEIQRPDATQQELALYIDKQYDPLQIAASVAAHGYFESEPLIAVWEGGRVVVVEGNRRLTALMGLADSNLRSMFARQNKGWASLRVPALPETYPVVIVEDRRSVVPLLGFRHISGIAPWEPFAQARFIANLVEEGQTLDEIAKLVGRTSTEIRKTYRDYEIIRQASDEFRLDTQRAEESFGVFTAAMNQSKIREYINAPAPRDVDPEYWPLPTESAPKVHELLTYIFGGEEGKGRVVHDSRRLRDLAEVLSDPTGSAQEVLRETQDLEEARQVLVDQEQLSRFRTQINGAARALRAAKALGVEELDPATERTLREVQRLSDELLRLPFAEPAQ